VAVNQDYERGLIRTDQGLFFDKLNFGTDPRGSDFGARGDGVYDDRRAFAVADAFATAAGVSLALSTGTYSIQSDITLSAGLRMQNGATLKPASGVTVTINGPFWAGDHQVFDLSAGGAVVLATSVEASPLWWGVAGDGATDDTEALNAAFGGGGTIRFRGTRTYLVTDELNITENRTNIIFSGKQCTKFLFRPTEEGKACFNFEHGEGEVLYECRARGGFTVYSDDTVLQKVAVRVTDVSDFYCPDLAVGPIGQFTGNGSIGIQTRGREFIRFPRYTLASDIPISIEKNPNSSLHADHLTLSHGECFPSGSNPNVQIEDGVYLSNFTMDEQAWVGGGDGLVFDDTTSETTSHGIELKNIRWEQMVGTDGYMVRLNFSGGSSGAAQGVKLSNIFGGLTARGFYLRKCSNVTLVSTQYVGDGVGIDADGTCDAIRFLNAFWQTGSTLNMSGLTQVYGSGEASGDPVNGESDALWLKSTHDRLRFRLFGTSTIAEDVSLADAASYLPQLQGGTLKVAQIQVSASGTTDHEGGLWTWDGSTVKKIAGTANTADTNSASNLCVFSDSGTLTVLNNLGETVDAHVFITWSSAN
jgi:hypothetical protein